MLLTIPSQHGNIELKWDATKYEGIIPTGEGTSQLLYGGNQFDLICAASSLSEAIAIDKSVMVRMENNLNIINNSILTGTLTYHFEDINNSGCENCNIVELSWVGNCSLSKSGVLKIELELTVSHSLFLEGNLILSHNDNYKVSKVNSKRLTLANYRDYLTSLLEGSLGRQYHDYEKITYSDTYGLSLLVKLHGYKWLTDLQITSIQKTLSASVTHSNAIQLETIRKSNAISIQAIEAKKSASSGGGGGWGDKVIYPFADFGGKGRGMPQGDYIERKLRNT